MTWVPFESLLFTCFKKRLSFHQGIEYHWAFYKCQLSSPNPSQVFVPLLFLWNCRSRYSTDFTRFSHLYISTPWKHDTQTVSFQSVLQHAISNISKLSGHGYDRFLFKYVRPPKRKGIIAVIWGVLVLNFPQNHVLHTFQFVKAHKDFKISEITILTWGHLTLRVFSFWVHWSCVQLTIAHSLWALSPSPTETT